MTTRWTSQDVELLFPENNGKRYEIVIGTLITLHHFMRHYHL
jgi:hypothetical protein